MTLEPSSPLPLYHQLERVLAERIADGRYRDGFPGDLDLAAEFSVSRGTVRQALDRLARSGLIVRHQGRGSFVAAPLEYPLGRFYRFAHEMHVRGIPESSRVLARGADPGGSATQADIQLLVSPAPGGGSVLSADARLFLSGRIAQFGRALAGDVSRRMFEQFASALDQAATTGTVPEVGTGPGPVRIVLGVLLARLRRLFARRR